MSDDERPLFDDEIIQLYRQVPDILKVSRDDFAHRLNSVTNLSNNQLRILLNFLGETTFRFMPLLYQSSAFNMALMNDVDSD
jgi:hypothetical protein